MFAKLSMERHEMIFVRKEINLSRLSEVAESLSKIIVGGDVIILKGDIGAGKTTLVALAAKHLGVLEGVTSPTFAIVNTYKIPLNKNSLQKLIHVDTYRLDNANEIYDLGLETLFDEGAVTFIEWGERIRDYIDENHFVVEIDEIRPESRDFKFEVVGTLDPDRQEEIINVLVEQGWKKND